MCCDINNIINSMLTRSFVSLSWIWGSTAFFVVAINIARLIKIDNVRMLWASALVLWSLILPLLYTSGKQQIDYVIGALSSMMAMKVTSLFFGLSDGAETSDMCFKEFWVRFTTYPDKIFMKKYRKHCCYFHSKSNDPKADLSLKHKRDQILLEGRLASLEMLLSCAGYWIGLQLLLMLLPSDPSNTIQKGNLFQYFILNYLSGVGVMLTLGFAYTLYSGLSGLVYGVKTQPIFNRPEMSCSMRDLWSKRWNLVFKNQFYEIVFSMISGDSNHATRRQKTLAAMATFLFSGVLHEYLILTTFGPNYVGYNLLYFLIHGLLTTLETLFLNGMLRKLSPLWRIACMHLVALVLIPLFSFPYLANDFYIKADQVVLWKYFEPHRYQSVLFTK